MAKLPYPPAPELGWYSDDQVEGAPDSAVGTAEPENDYGQPSTADAATNSAFTAEPFAKWIRISSTSVEQEWKA